MRYFALLDFQYVVLLVFLGLTVLILIYLAFYGHALHRGKQEKSDETEGYPEGIRVSRNPIPPILIFLYVTFVLWALGYLIVVGLLGGPL